MLDAEQRPRTVLLLIIAFTLAVGAIGSAITQPAIPVWYAALAKPDFTPPNWLFAPVWTALYLMMAVAAWRVWRLPPDPVRHNGLVFWGLQLALNLMWSGLFFGLRRPDLALICIIAMWLAIGVTMMLFLRRDRIASLLLIPYLAWVGFAGILNHAIWRLNP